MITCDVTVSLDGFVAGPDQSFEEPLGVGGEHLHRWQFEQHNENAFEVDAICSAGAYLMGRNMFSSGRGEWNLDWRGWWGEDPPYHAPVFVLTHHEREPVEMQGGTSYHFVTGGPEEARRLAIEAAGDRHVAVAGGASTINQYLRAGQIDELRLHVAPIVLGSGEALFRDLAGMSFEMDPSRSTSLVTHVTLLRAAE